MGNLQFSSNSSDLFQLRLSSAISVSPLASMERLWVPEQERAIISYLTHKRHSPVDGFRP